MDRSRTPSSRRPEEGDLFRSGEALLRAGLKLQHLKLIVAIEESGQISAAAGVMNMSQPAASRLLAEMETIARAKICERVKGGVALTPVGTALARRARAVLLELREAGREIADIKTGFGGTVTIGAVTAPALSLAVPAILKVSGLYPGIEVNINVETSNLLARSLLAARYDFVIGRIPDDLNPRLFEARQIDVEKACLIVRSGHPLLARPASLGELRNFTWVFQPEGSLLRRTVEQLFLGQGVELPESTINTPSLLITMALIRQSDAVAPVARDVADFISDQAGFAPGIVALPTDFEIVAEPYAILSARGRALTPSARLVYDLILDEARRVAG